MRNPPILISVIGFFAMLAGFGYLFFGLRVLGFDWFGALGDLPELRARRALGLAGDLGRARLDPRRPWTLDTPGLGSRPGHDRGRFQPLRGGPRVLPVPGHRRRSRDGTPADRHPLVSEQPRGQGGLRRERAAQRRLNGRQVIAPAVDGRPVPVTPANAGSSCAEEGSHAGARQCRNGRVDEILARSAPRAPRSTVASS